MESRHQYRGVMGIPPCDYEGMVSAMALSDTHEHACESNSTQIFQTVQEDIKLTKLIMKYNLVQKSISCPVPMVIDDGTLKLEAYITSICL
jgi:hypothetical protein